MVSLNKSVIDTITKTGNLRIVPVECHGDDISLTFHDNPLFSLILLVHVSKFNVHNTPITLPLRLRLTLAVTNDGGAQPRVGGPREEAVTPRYQRSRALPASSSN